MFRLQGYQILIEKGKFELVLTDVDVISKLAHWRLLDALPLIFSCKVTAIATLPSLVHRAKKACNKPDKIFRDENTAEYAYKFLGTLGQLPSPDGDAVSILQRYPKIDAGEAVLLAIAYKIEKTILATGDKNAIKSLHAIYQEGQFTNLKGRLISLEQILKCCLDLLGLTNLQDKLKLSPNHDAAVKSIFGSRYDAPLASVEVGLDSYIRSLYSGSGDLLHLDKVTIVSPPSILKY